MNLDGTFFGTTAAIRAMQPAKKGSIINVASLSGIKASAGAAAYCCSKAAVIQLSRVAALECAEATAEKNEKFLLEMLDVDERARYLGEWAIGTNKRIDKFIGNILYDEKIGGLVFISKRFWKKIKNDDRYIDLMRKMNRKI